MELFIRTVSILLPLTFLVIVIAFLWAFGAVAKFGGIPFCLGVLSGVALYLIGVRIKLGYWV